MVNSHAFVGVQCTVCYFIFVSCRIWSRSLIFLVWFFVLSYDWASKLAWSLLSQLLTFLYWVILLHFRGLLSCWPWFYRAWTWFLHRCISRSFPVCFPCVFLRWIIFRRLISLWKISSAALIEFKTVHCWNNMLCTVYPRTRDKLWVRISFALWSTVL